MIDIIIRIVLHIVSFGVCWYALNGLDWSKFIKQGKVVQAQLLLIVLSMALGYLLAQFLLAIGFSYYPY